MRRLAFAAVLALACGPGSDVATLSAGLEIHGITPDQIGAVQIAVLSMGDRFLCADLVRTCLVNQVKDSDLVRLRGSDGADHRALRVPASSAGLTGAGQTLTASLPPGSNYLVVAEILSKDAQLIASGCEALQQASAGTNPPLTIRAQPLDPVPTCDPRID